VGALLIFVAVDTSWNISDREGFSETASAIGTALLDKYALPFEVASILLLAAVVGSIVLVRPESAEEGPDEA
jgi:NADH-quinone oxidoreductase subunit J